MTSLEGKVFIVTGASEGVGAKLAALLRRRGAKLALNARDETKMRAAAAPDDLIIAGDLRRDETRAAIVDRAVQRFGGLDCLINNAGRGSYYSPSRAPLDDARDLFELNFFAPLHLAQLAAPLLAERRGTLVNVASIAAQISLPWLPIYSASKFALASLSTSQRMELRARGVHVMAVFPGYVDTDFQAHATGNAPPAAVVKGKRFAVTADACAEAILRGIEKRRNVVVTPRMGWAAIWMNRLLPWAIESAMERA